MKGRKVSEEFILDGEIEERDWEGGGLEIGGKTVPMEPLGRLILFWERLSFDTVRDWTASDNEPFQTEQPLRVTIEIEEADNVE